MAADGDDGRAAPAFRLDHRLRPPLHQEDAMRRTHVGTAVALVVVFTTAPSQGQVQRTTPPAAPAQIQRTAPPAIRTRVDPMAVNPANRPVVRMAPDTPVAARTRRLAAASRFELSPVLVSRLTAALDAPLAGTVTLSPLSMVATKGATRFEMSFINAGSVGPMEGVSTGAADLWGAINAAAIVEVTKASSTQLLVDCAVQLFNKSEQIQVLALHFMPNANGTYILNAHQPVIDNHVTFLLTSPSTEGFTRAYVATDHQSKFGGTVFRLLSCDVTQF
jgi:hypothetical protein